MASCCSIHDVLEYTDDKISGVSRSWDINARHADLDRFHMRRRFESKRSSSMTTFLVKQQ